MTAPHLSKAHAPCRDHFAWVGVMLIAAAFSALAAEPEQPEQPVATEEPTVTAVYKLQELSFHYRPGPRAYTCHELEHRVAVILVGLGARDDINVQARNCDIVMTSDGALDVDPTFGRTDPYGRNDPFGRDPTDPWAREGRSRDFARSSYERNRQSITVRVRMMMPVELTPKVQKEIEKDKSRRELVSRVTGNPAAAMNDPIVFAARRQEVTLSQRTIRLRAEDCDLLQQMTQQVIRKLDVRVKRQSFGCGPRTASRIPPQLTVEALVPTGALLPMPAPEEDKKQPEQTQASETSPE
jgi:hypothetical protein